MDGGEWLKKVLDTKGLVIDCKNAHDLSLLGVVHCFSGVR